MSVYTENGYKSRAHYLVCMSEDYGVSLSVVRNLANLLGESEDFDGLITQIEDIADGFDGDASMLCGETDPASDNEAYDN